MRNSHEEGLAKSVMLLCAFQTVCVVRGMHDKSRNLPDPDIFAFDKVHPDFKYQVMAGFQCCPLSNPARIPMIEDTGSSIQRKEILESAQHNFGPFTQEEFIATSMSHTDKY
ncbi:unnamed protein product [Amoebophrya sp. A120]|nr:unnamed protein product [Amoebophrya sp. A120]|eukprot:GSA120T00013093001.1